jgi:hypothetical protein
MWGQNSRCLKVTIRWCGYLPVPFERFAKRKPDKVTKIKKFIMQNIYPLLLVVSVILWKNKYKDLGTKDGVKHGD